MSADTGALFTIAAMAAATCLTRILGYSIAARLSDVPPALQRFLDHLPGTIIIAIIVPDLLSGGWLNLSAALVCLGTARVSKNLIAVMAAGVVYVSLIRHLL